MAVTINRKPAGVASKVGTKPALSTKKIMSAKAEPQIRTKTQQAIDELGALQDKVKPDNARIKKLKSTITAELKGRATNAAQAITDDGGAYDAILSAASMTTVVEDMDELYKAAGHDKFMVMVKVSVEKMKELVPIQQRSKFVRESRTGARSLKLTKRD